MDLINFITFPCHLRINITTLNQSRYFFMKYSDNRRTGSYLNQRLQLTVSHIPVVDVSQFPVAKTDDLANSAVHLLLRTRFLHHNEGFCRVPVVLPVSYQAIFP
jgi:hypothetical protein